MAADACWSLAFVREGGEVTGVLCLSWLASASCQHAARDQSMMHHSASWNLYPGFRLPRRPPGIENVQFTHNPL